MAGEIYYAENGVTVIAGPDAVPGQIYYTEDGYQYYVLAKGELKKVMQALKDGKNYSSFVDDPATVITTNETDFRDALKDYPRVTAIGQWDTSNATDMSGMLNGMKFETGDITNWNTSNVRDMTNMFSGATNFNQDISSWDVTNVENMDGMFQNAKAFNQDLSVWNVKHIKSKPEDFNKGANPEWLAHPEFQPRWGKKPRVPGQELEEEPEEVIPEPEPEEDIEEEPLGPEETMQSELRKVLLQVSRNVYFSTLPIDIINKRSKSPYMPSDDFSAVVISAEIDSPENTICDVSEYEYKRMQIDIYSHYYANALAMKKHADKVIRKRFSESIKESAIKTYDDSVKLHRYIVDYSIAEFE